MQFTPEQLVSAEAFGVSLAANLVFKIMEKAFSGKEPEFKEVLDESIRKSSELFNEEFNEVEIHIVSFSGLLNDIVSNYVSPKENSSENSLSKLIQFELENRKLIYHVNEKTMQFYCELFSKVFCFVFHEKILSSKFSPLLVAEHLISSKENSIKQNSKLDYLLSGSKSQSEKLESLESKINTLVSRNASSNVGSMIYIEDSLLDEIEDDRIANKVKLIEELKEKRDFLNGIDVANNLMLEIPKSNIHLYSKVFHLLLGIHLQGNEKEYQDGVEFYNKSEIKTPYSKVICSGLLNNLMRWGDGFKLISSIGKTDLISFSKSQKDVYYQIRSMLEFHLKLQDEALKSFNSIDDKESDEFKYLSLLFYSRNLKESKLDVALEILNNKKDLRLLNAAINYVLDRFNLLQSDFKNPFMAIEKLREYFEVILNKVPLILDNEEEKGIFYESNLTGLICIHHLLGKFEEARKYINSGKRIGITEYVFLHNAALCMFLAGDYHEAFELLSKMDFKNLIKTNAFDMYIHSISKIKKEFDYAIIINQIDSLGLSIMMSDKLKSAVQQYSLSSKDYLEIAHENNKKYSSQAWSYFDYAEALLKCHKVKDAEEPLLKAKEFEDIKIVAYAKLAKYYALDRKNYNEAINYYEKIISKDSPVQEIVEFLHCLNLEKEFSKILKFVDEADPHEQVPKVQLYKAYALWQLGQVDIAWSIMKTVVKYFQNDPTVMQNYASLSYERGNINEVVWGLEKQALCVPSVGEVRMRLSQALMANGDFERAVQEAKKAVECDFTNDLIHFNFINIHLSATKHCPDSTFINSKEFAELHSDLLSNFNLRFPQSKLLRPQVLKYDENNQLDLSEMKEQLKQLEERNIQVQNYYWDQKFPLTFVMQTLNRNAHEVWSNMISTGFLKGIFVGSSNVNLLNEEIKNITNRKGKTIIDPIALFSFQSAGRLELLSKVKGLCVGTETITHLADVHQRLISMGDGYLSLGVQDGNMIKEEISKEQLDRTKSYIRGIIDFCNGKLEVVSVPKDYSLNIDKRLLDVFDPVYREIVYFSENSLTCILGDWNLLAFLRNYSHKNCSIQSVLLYLNNSEVLNSNDYHFIVSEWLLYNYRGIVYTSTDIGHYLRNSKDIKRTSFLMDRVFEGPDFGTDTNKVTFCAELFSDFSDAFRSHMEYLDKLKNYINSKLISEQNKLFFILTVFSRCIDNEKTRPVVEELFPLLEIKDYEGNVVTVEYAKEILRQAHKRELELEQKRYEQKLGLNKKD